ncbi:MAG: thiamine diphosphokinase [Rhodobacteraceae bacterium]|nr:thiamine diphosphokinase [Paracoccaceae bacterium]
MTEGTIVRSTVGVTVLGAGEVTADLLRLALAHAPRLVAADGGAAAALGLGTMPEAVIGDLDSLDAATLAALPAGRVHRIADQETTDFDKCLAAIAAPLVVAVGFTGARLDHEMAAFSSLIAHAGRAVVLLGPCDVAFAAPPELDLSVPAGTRVSLFPMGEVSGRSEGLRWPIDGLRLAPGGRIGTSNLAVDGRVRLRLSAPRMLVFLPRDCLAAAISALAARPAGPAAARGG